MGANREFKSSVFATLFNDSKRLISLYNAISGNELPLSTFVEITTLEDILFTERHNDIAFLIEEKLVVLIEHQSTINENMPLRLLIYLARVYEKIIVNDAIYKSKLLNIPKPDFIVLYNGVDNFPDEKILRLSDAYMEQQYSTDLGGTLELEARVVNINEGHNEKIVKKSKELYGYVRFVGKVRDNIRVGLDLKAAITKAVTECIKEGVLVDFLTTHSSEVVNMLTTEWNIEDAKRVWKLEAWEEGRIEGVDLSKKIINDLRERIPIDIIAAKHNVPLSTVRDIQSFFEESSQ